MSGESRSYEGRQPGQQLYARIDFCNDARTLWDKIVSGHYDWLGVYPDRDGRRRFLVGSPPVPRLKMTVTGVASEGGASGEHRVTVETPDHPGPGEHDFPTEEQARADFRSKVERLAVPDGSSALFRVRLYTGGELAEEEFVVRALPNVF